MTRKIMRERAVCEAVGLSRSTVYRMERRGKFPNRVRLGEQSVGWYQDEIQRWLDSRLIVNHPSSSAA